MLSSFPKNLSCCNFSLFLLALLAVDDEQFITLFSDLVDAALKENYALVLLSHSLGPHPRHIAICPNILTSLKGNKGDNNLTTLWL